jgi:hypothetical protein
MARERFERCRHLVWEEGAHSNTVAPGPYCQNPVGVFPLIDCPEYQGRRCRHFEERADEPVPASAEKIEELSVRLSEDYLSWRYWRRVARLIPTEAPPPPDPE